MNGNDTDAVAEIQRITDGGVDYALDPAGLPALTAQCVEALRQQGTAAILRRDRVLDQLQDGISDTA